MEAILKLLGNCAIKSELIGPKLRLPTLEDLPSSDIIELFRHSGDIWDLTKNH